MSSAPFPATNADGINHRITAPARFITAMTFCEGKNRSTSMPSTKGDRIEAIGPAEKASPINNDILCCAITSPSVTDQLPQIKNCMNIINERRGISKRCCAIASSLPVAVVVILSSRSKVIDYIFEYA